MTTVTSPVVTKREPELLDQTVVLIGGSSGIGLEAARRARAEGAEVILAGRNVERLADASQEVGARSFAAFDANDPSSLARFFDRLPARIDHALVTVGGPHYGPILEMNPAAVRAALSERVVLALDVACHAVGKMRPGGTLLFMGMTGARKISRELGIASAVAAVLPPFVAALALEVAPVRVNLIAAGFVDTPLSASILGEDLDRRRAQLQTTLPIGRVVVPSDIAALAVQLMINTAVTGATFDIDGGEQFLGS